MTGRTSGAPAPQPFFTVVIPTYRRPTLLREAVDSVLAQTFGDFELIVVDDDPDGSGRPAVAGFEDPRVSYVANDRGRGGAGTRNAGIFRARGAWVAFLDDDDVWLPEKLERQHAKIVASGDDVGIVYTGHAVYDFEKREVISVRGCRMSGWIARDLLVRNWVGGMFSVAARTDLLHEVGGMDERFAALQDLDLFVRMAQRARVEYVDEPLVLVRKDNSDRITRNPRKKLEASRLFWLKYRREIDREPLLRHRAAARVFTYALAAGDAGAVLRSAPWMLAGLVVDPGNFREVASRLVRLYRYEQGRRRERALRGRRGLGEPSSS